MRCEGAGPPPTGHAGRGRPAGPGPDFVHRNAHARAPGAAPTLCHRARDEAQAVDWPLPCRPLPRAPQPRPVAISPSVIRAPS